MASKVILGGLLTFGLLTTAIPASAEQQMTITGWGGAYQMSQREAYFKPFMEKTGVKIIEEEYNGEVSKVRAMVQSGSVSWDVLDVDSQGAIEGCDQGVFEVIDWNRLGDRDAFLDGAATECAVGGVTYSTIFAYNADVLKDGPTKIADLFDVEKFPGKRALQKTPYVLLEMALQADGVPTADIYNVLNTPEGIDRAFAKLDTIRDHVVWWETGEQPAQLLANGEVVMTTAWNGRIFNAMKEGKNFKTVFDGQILDFNFWVIPKGTKNIDLAYDFLKFATSPEMMATQSKFIAYGPTRKDVTPEIDELTLSQLPTAPQNNKDSLVQNYQFWGDHGEELRQRFNNWLNQ